MKKLLLFFLFALFVYLLIPRNDWKRYYSEKLYKPADQLTLKVLELHPIPGKAIDFGFGCGNDTIALLQQGWQVWAIDAEEDAKKTLLARKDLSQEKELYISTEQFETVDWAHLPDVDLVLAIHTLPFSKPEDFDAIWKSLTDKIVPNGYFAGTFFGTKYQGFTDEEKKRMTFLERDVIQNLFKNFEIVQFEEKEYDRKNGTGRTIHSHIFTVIARKLL